MDDLRPVADVLKLPAILDMQAALSLAEAFLSRRGTDLQVDAAEVQRLGGQCLQVLLAARAAWAGDGCDFLIGNSSQDFIAALELLGVAPETLAYQKELLS